MKRKNKPEFQPVIPVRSKTYPDVVKWESSPSWEWAILFSQTMVKMARGK